MQEGRAGTFPRTSWRVLLGCVCPGSLVIQETGQNATGTYPAVSVRAE